MSDDTLLQKLELDLSSALNNQVAQMAIIEAWRAECNGDPYSVTKSRDEKYTTVVDKLIKKSIESAVPSLVEPFLGSRIVSMKGRDAQSQSKAKTAEKVLNYYWNYGIKPEELMEPLVRDLQTDGTVITKVVWKDGKPGAELTALDNLVFDPSASNLKDCAFIIDRGKVSIASILAAPAWYGEHTLDSLKALNPSSDEVYDRDIDGVDNSFNFEDRLRQLVSINTFYGVMEIDDELKAVVAVWSSDMLISIKDSPYPASWNGKPFVGTVYIPNHSIYGKNIGDVISTDQKVSTAVQRAIMAHLDKSTNGQRGYRVGALDPVQRKNFINGRDFEYQDKDPMFWEGQFNQVGAEVFNIQDRIKNGAEELVGIGRLNAGLDPRALNSNVSATASNLVNSNAQRRLLLIVRHISAMLEDMFRKWLDLAVMMGETVGLEVNGEVVEVSGFDLEGNYDLTLDVTTDGQRTEDITALNMALQTLANTPGIPPSVSMETTARLMEAMRFYDLGEQLSGVAEQMRQQEQQPNPMQQVEQQMAVQREITEVAKIASDTKLNEAKAMESFVDSQNASYGL